MKLILIANPCSRGTVSAAIIDSVRERFEAARFAVDLYVTRHHEHGMNLLDGLPLDTYDAVVAMGGDGTTTMFSTVSLTIVPPASALPHWGLFPWGGGIHLPGI